MPDKTVNELVSNLSSEAKWGNMNRCNFAEISQLWMAYLELQFCQVVAVYTTSKITESELKFQAVVFKISHDILSQISDLVNNSYKRNWNPIYIRFWGVRKAK